MICRNHYLIFITILLITGSCLSVLGFSSRILSVPVSATGFIGITIENFSAPVFHNYGLDNNNVEAGETFEVWIDDTYLIDTVQVPLAGTTMNAQFSPSRNGYLSGLHQVKLIRKMAKNGLQLTSESALIEDTHFITLQGTTIKVLPERFLSNPSNITVIVSNGTNVDANHKLEVSFSSGEKIGTVELSANPQWPVSKTFEKVAIPNGNKQVILIKNLMNGYFSTAEINKSTFTASVLSLPSNSMVDSDFIPRIQFSEYMDKTSFQDVGAVELKRMDKDNNPVEKLNFTIQYIEAEKIMKVIPNNKLLPDSKYQMALSTAVRYQSGANIPSNIVFTFSTLPSAGLKVSDFFAYPGVIEKSNLSTQLSYELSENADSAEIRLYSKSGKLMRRFSDLPLSAGYHDAVVWDLTDHYGMKVPNGVYYLQMYIKKGDNAQFVRQKLMIRK